MKKPLRALLIGLFLLLPFYLFAGDIELMIEDEDLGLPLEGAEVLIRGDGRQFTCGADGKVRFDLPNGQQTVIQISYPGYGTKRLTVMAQEGAVQRVTVALQLGGVMVGRELVVEAERPDTSETKSGRSVAISDRELARTAEIGIIEDVMNSVKLLPGVGYSGMFGATPSIRGGDPGDLMAVFDGFYLERPYHWIGAVSIFDPKMVSSARLSHGVFSSRYGHTVSGLLEITSKTPSPTETELETAIGSSAASLNLSIPLNGKGGILFMGKITYWDTMIWAAKQLNKTVDNEILNTISYIETAPYIRSAALAVNYRLTPDIEWRLNSFFGSDGVGAKVTNKYDEDDVQGDTNIAVDYNNYQGFLITGITASPATNLALKATGGVGFLRTISDDIFNSDVTVHYNQEFLDKFPALTAPLPSGFGFALDTDKTYTSPDANVSIKLDHTLFNAQLRGDLDWHLGNGFITAFGVQELYTMWQQKQDINMILDMPIDELLDSDFASGLSPLELLFLTKFSDLHSNAELIRPTNYKSGVQNHGLTTSAYGLLEYASPEQRFGAELGLRLDHLYFVGKNFTTQTLPVVNPRLNIDINLLKSNGYIDSLDLTVGSGLFSSVNQLVSFIDKDWGINKLKFNRSWTSIAGVKIDVAEKYSFNIEGYYKRIFDRAYLGADILSAENIQPDFYFDGVGNVAGFDLQLQKLESRYWDGWISYTFTWAKYYDPHGGPGLSNGSTGSVSSQWYYPDFHRFHNANIVLNIKPTNWFNISTRFGFASGQLRTRTVMTDEIEPYPAVYIKEDGTQEIIQKYRRVEKKDENGNPVTKTERGDWNFPWDIKFSFFIFDMKGRVSTEIYLALENLTALFPRNDNDDNIRFNTYTGKIDNSPALNFNIPMISFGFKWRY